MSLITTRAAEAGGSDPYSSLWPIDADQEPSDGRAGKDPEAFAEAHRDVARDQLLR
ncbi:MAG: hypothetical protein M3472_00335 [Chloroflexota bacterium]|nr:hypothetical protein [Chloroflexota bacterium]